MRGRFYMVLSTCTIIILSLSVVIGLVQVRDNLRNYGMTYEVITITNGDETRTTMSIWTNVVFLLFLCVVIYLLVLPLIEQFEESRKEELV